MANVLKQLLKEETKNERTTTKQTGDFNLHIVKTDHLHLSMRQQHGVLYSSFLLVLAAYSLVAAMIRL